MKLRQIFKLYSTTKDTLVYNFMYCVQNLFFFPEKINMDLYNKNGCKIPLILIGTKMLCTKTVFGPIVQFSP